MVLILKQLKKHLLLTKQNLVNLTEIYQLLEKKNVFLSFWSTAPIPNIKKIQEIIMEWNQDENSIVNNSIKFAAISILLKYSIISNLVRSLDNGFPFTLKPPQVTTQRCLGIILEDPTEPKNLLLQPLPKPKLFYTEWHNITYLIEW